MFGKSPEQKALDEKAWRLEFKAKQDEHNRYLRAEIMKFVEDNLKTEVDGQLAISLTYVNLNQKDVIDEFARRGWFVHQLSNAGRWGDFVHIVFRRKSDV
jgi:hypothetical protein